MYHAPAWGETGPRRPWTRPVVGTRPSSARTVPWNGVTYREIAPLAPVERWRGTTLAARSGNKKKRQSFWTVPPTATWSICKEPTAIVMMNDDGQDIFPSWSERRWSTSHWARAQRWMLYERPVAGRPCLARHPLLPPIHPCSTHTCSWLCCRLITWSDPVRFPHSLLLHKKNDK
jgi:hypothetical protein